MSNEILDLINSNFSDSIKAKEEVRIILQEPISKAIQLIISAFNNSKKLLVCGNGGSAADSQHFVAEFTGRYELERKALPAIALTTDTSALTAIGNDYSFDVVFSRQVEALGMEGDILFAISTSGNSKNVIKAIESAKRIGLKVIALTGKDGGKIKEMLTENDVSMCVPVNRTARIQEVHILILHTICDAVDTLMFKS